MTGRAAGIRGGDGIARDGTGADGLEGEREIAAAERAEDGGDGVGETLVATKSSELMVLPAAAPPQRRKKVLLLAGTAERRTVEP